VAINGYALTGIAAGSIFVYAGFKGKSVLGTLQTIVQGQSPSSTKIQNPITLAPGSSANTFLGSSGAVGGAASAPGNVSGVNPGVSSPSALQQYAFSLFGQYGWGADQQFPLVQLWNRESGWNVHAYYPGTTTNNPDPTGNRAYGIPQSLPPGKMASAGADWVNNGETQIRWGLGYIKATYGNPQGAWNHEVANGWY
jgi:hypothetical protein